MNYLQHIYSQYPSFVVARTNEIDHDKGLTLVHCARNGNWTARQGLYARSESEESLPDNEEAEVLLVSHECEA